MDHDTFKLFHDYWRQGNFSINIETWYQSRGKRFLVDVKDFYELRKFQREEPKLISDFALKSVDEALMLYKFYMTD